MLNPRILSQGDRLPTEGIVLEQLSRFVSEKTTARS